MQPSGVCPGVGGRHVPTPSIKCPVVLVARHAGDVCYGISGKGGGRCGRGVPHCSMDALRACSPHLQYCPRPPRRRGGTHTALTKMMLPGLLASWGPLCAHVLPPSNVTVQCSQTYTFNVCTTIRRTCGLNKGLRAQAAPSRVRRRVNNACTPLADGISHAVTGTPLRLHHAGIK